MQRLRRLIKISRVIATHRLDTFFRSESSQTDSSSANTSIRKDANGRSHAVSWPLRLVLFFFSLLPKPKASRAVRLRMALQELGPIFVKFGQLLSTRRDLLPPDLADELAKLQDQVEPFDGQLATRIIESELGESVSTAFSYFSTTALASASVAQVHDATTLDGENVVVKVIRPGIEKIIRQDMKLLFFIARMAEKYSQDGRRLRPVEVVNDYEQVIFDELDLKREAANCSQLKRNFEHTTALQVPKVYWEHSTPQILVMERMNGIPVSDIAALEAAGTDMKLLAERGVEIFFTQVFEHNFFHADMHPGNIFVDATDPLDPAYIALDCAIMGSLSDFDRHYLARNLLAVFNRNYRLVAQLHVECGWVPEGTDVHAFEGMIRSACEPVFDKPLSEISFGTLLIYLFQAARRFGMEVQPSLVLLQKTLLNIEGLGRQLYPQLDLWTTAHPFLEKWIEQRYSPLTVFTELKEQSPTLLESLPELPEMIFAALKNLGNSSAETARLQARMQAVEASQRKSRFLNLALFTGLLIGLAIWHF